MHCGRLHNLSRTEMQRYATTQANPRGHVTILLLLLHGTIQCILFLVCPARRKILRWDGPGKAEPLEPGEEINSNIHNQIVCLSLQHQPLHLNLDPHILQATHALSCHRMLLGAPPS
jgi:hypothetical protein